MDTEMKVILLERVGRTGHIGDEVNVKDGFARNYLLPQGKALRATEANRHKVARDRAEPPGTARTGRKVRQRPLPAGALPAFATSGTAAGWEAARLAFQFSQFTTHGAAMKIVE